MEFSSIIRPTDNWNIAPVVYPRIDDKDGHGYIPGDLYANALFYFTKPRDLVIAPEALGHAGRRAANRPIAGGLQQNGGPRR